MSRKQQRRELPHSIIESEILPKLPAKSVGRCMCVCKQWQSFLSAPMFTDMHLRHNVTAIDQYKLLVIDDDMTFRTVDHRGQCNRRPTPDPNHDTGHFILASLDGLVCLGSRTMLAFWNPLTGAYKQLAPLHDTFRAFPFRISDGVGFYTDSSNDYKLVYLSGGGVLGVYIYSHTLDSWRQIHFPKGVISDDPLYVVCSEATSFGQCLYFFITDMGVGTRCVICFDVKTKTFRRIGLPDVVTARNNIYSQHTRVGLIPLYGCIHMCVYYYELHRKQQLVVDLWRMDGADGWAKVFSVPSYSSENQKRICTATIGNWFVVLEEENNSFTKMNTEDFTRRYRYFCSPSEKYRARRIIYVETLVSP